LSSALDNALDRKVAKMIYSIMVPIDGSDFSCQALPLALSVAHTTGATLKLVQVHTPLYPMLAVDGVGAINQQFERETEQQELEYLGDLAARTARESGIAVTHQLVSGDVAPALAQYARDASVDLVVMTTHGRGGFARGLLGSVADELIREINLPVLLTRPLHRGTAVRPANPFDHILVPLDGSALSESILPFALDVGGSQTKYTLLRVREPSDTIGYGYYAAAVLREEQEEEEANERALRYLEHIAAPLRESGTRVETAVRSGATAPTEIVGYADDHKVGMIALSTHGRHGLSRVAVGSVADRILRSFDGCVMVFRPTRILKQVEPRGSQLLEDSRSDRGRNAGIS
jgi:nucleotide-binding universal stress UspA family protein